MNMLTDGFETWLMLAQEKGAPAQGPDQFWMMIVPWLPIILLFFLLIILPQHANRKSATRC